MTKNFRGTGLLWLTVAGMLAACGGDDCPPNKRAIGGRCVAADEGNDAAMGEPDGMMPMDAMDPATKPDAMMPMDMMGDVDAAMDEMMALDDAMMPMDMMDEDAAMPDPCAALDCVANSECVVADEMASCACLEGYVETAQGCERDECIAVDDAPPICGKNATCDDPAPAAGEPRAADDYTCTCEDNYDDCDGDMGESAVIGCEVSLLDDAKNCGACGNACAGNLACVDGACAQAADRIEAAELATCFLSGGESGAFDMKCAGANQSKLYGPGTPTFDVNPNAGYQSTPTAVAGFLRVRDVAIGLTHACVIPEGGDEVVCWGTNTAGQLASSNTQNHDVDSLVRTGLTGVTDIAVGSLHTCAVQSGVVQCWGSNLVGQLGEMEGSVSSSSRPVAVSGIRTAVSIDASGDATCAVLADQTVRCWGSVVRTSPSIVQSEEVELENGAPLRAKSVSTGGFVYGSTLSYPTFCALTVDDTVVCWGNGGLGLINGDRSVGQSNYVAIEVQTGLADVVDVSVGGTAACAVAADGTLKCWGADGFGDPRTVAANPPVTLGLPSGAGAVDVEVGGNHACVRADSGAVLCRGLNNFGQLGRGRLDDAYLSWGPPVGYP